MPKKLFLKLHEITPFLHARSHIYLIVYLQRKTLHVCSVKPEVYQRSLSLVKPDMEMDEERSGSSRIEKQEGVAE